MHPVAGRAGPATETVHAAHAVLVGQGLVIIDANTAMLVLAGRELVGIPAREAFPEPQYKPILQLIDWSMRTGIAAQVAVPAPDGRDGILSITPSSQRVRVVWRPVAAVSPREEAPVTLA